MTAFRAPPPPRHLVLLAGLLGAGCAGDEGPGAGGTAGYPERLDTAEGVLTLGRVERPPDYLFGDVTSVAADPRGRIYVADRFDSAGRYLHPGYRFPPDGGARYFYLVFEDGRHAGDTLPVPPYPGLGRTRTPYYWLTEGRTGKMVRGLSRVPFQPAPAWDVTPRGTVIGGDGAGPELVETDAAGDTVAVVDLPGPGSRPVPDEAERDSLAALEARIDSLPVPLPEVVDLGERVADRDLPRTLPALLDVVVARDGRIWVERWPPEGRPERRWYDVLRPDGGYVLSVVVPEPVADEPPPFITEDAFYGVVTDPATGIQRVVALSIGPDP